MHNPDDRSRTTFGKRRAPDATPDLPVRQEVRVRSGQTAGPLSWALRMAGIVGIAGVIVAYQLARLSRPDVAALATATSLTDPETTGAIASARITRLDPCGLPANDPLRP
jgi:hypothetical protein